MLLAGGYYGLTGQAGALATVGPSALRSPREQLGASGRDPCSWPDGVVPSQVAAGGPCSPL